MRALVVGGLGDVDRLQRAGGDRRRERIGEEIGPRALAQHVDDGLRRGDEAAHPPPSVLPSVPVTIWTRSPAPVSAGVPRPRSPRCPCAWQSSTSTKAPKRSARSQISFSFAT